MSFSEKTVLTRSQRVRQAQQRGRVGAAARELQLLQGEERQHELREHRTSLGTPTRALLL